MSSISSVSEAQLQLTGIHCLLGTNRSTGIVNQHIEALHALALEDVNKTSDRLAVVDVQSLHDDIDLLALLLRRGLALLRYLLESGFTTGKKNEVDSRAGKKDRRGGSDSTRSTSDNGCG